MADKRIAKVTHRITNDNYTGSIYLKVECESWADSKDGFEGKGIYGIENAKLKLALMDDCNENEFTIPDGNFVPAGGIGFPVSSDVWTHPNNTFIWSNGEPVVVCFSIRIEGPAFSNEQEEKLCTLKISSFSDANYTTRLDPDDRTYAVKVAATQKGWFPVYACEPEGNFLGGGSDCLEASKPIALLEGKDTLWIEHDPSAPTPRGNAPTEGDIIKLDINSNKCNGRSVKACYYIGDKQSQPPSSFLELGSPTRSLTTTVPRATVKPNNYAYKLEANFTSDPSNGQGHDDRFLHPLDYESTAHEDCDSCDVDKDIYGLKAAAVRGLARAGMNENVKVVVADMQVDVLDNEAGEPPLRQEDLVVKATLAQGFKTEVVESLPGTASWEFKGNMGTSLNRQDINTPGGGDPVLVKNIDFDVAFGTAVKTAYDYAVVHRQTLHTTLGYGSGSKRASSPAGQTEGSEAFIKHETVDAGLVGIFVSKATEKTTNISAGFNMDKLVTFNAQFGITEKEWDGEYYHTRTGGESKSVGWSGSVQIAGPSAWLEADPDSPLNPEDDFKLFAESHLSVNFAGTGASSSKTYKQDFDFDWNNGDVIATKTGDVYDTEFKQEGTDYSKVLELDSLNVSYDAKMFNGWALNITPPSIVSGGRWDNAGETAWSVSSQPRSPIRWTLSGTGSNAKLQAAMSKALITSEKSRKHAIRNVNPTGWMEQGLLDNTAFGALDADVYLDIEMGYDPASQNPFSALASVKGQTASGWDFLYNLQDNSIQVQKVYKAVGTSSTHPWAQKWKNLYQALNNAQDHSQQFDLDFAVAFKHDPGNFSNSGPSTTFTAGFDGGYERSLVEFADFWGKMKMTNNFRAGYQASTQLGPILNSRRGLFSLGTSFTYENDILETMGLFFNIHPGLDITAVGVATFGGYAIDANEGTAPLQPGTAYNKGFVYKFNIGGFTWKIASADKFRQHMRRQHNSTGWIGNLIGDCPILGWAYGQVASGKEDLWEYMLRTAPYRSLVIVRVAAQRCLQERNAEYDKIYNQLSVIDKAIAGSPKLIREVLGGGAYSSKGTLPICGIPEPAARVNTNWPYTTKTVKQWGGEEDLQDAINTMYLSLYTLPRTSLIENLNYPWGVIPPGAPRATLTSPPISLFAPFPCKLTKGQAYLAANYILNNTYDNTKDRCECIEKKFYEIQGFYGKSKNSEIHNYNWDDWSEQFESGPERGLISLAQDKIDKVVLDFVLAGKSPDKDDAKEFQLKIKSELFSVVTAAQIGADATRSVTDPVSHKGGPEPTADPLVIRQAIHNWGWDAAKGVQLLNLCKGLTGLTEKVLSVAAWIPKKLLGWLMGRGSSQHKQKIESQTWSTQNPCKLYIPPGTTASDGSCYEAWRLWAYYKTYVKSHALNLQNSHVTGSRTLWTQVFSMYPAAWATAWRGAPIAALAASGAPKCASNSTTKAVANNVALQKDMAKISMIYNGGNYMWMSSSVNSGILGEDYDMCGVFTKTIGPAPSNTIVEKLGSKDFISYFYEMGNIATGYTGETVFSRYLDESDEDHKCMAGFSTEDYSDSYARDLTTITNDICDETGEGYGTNCTDPAPENSSPPARYKNWLDYMAGGTGVTITESAQIHAIASEYSMFSTQNQARANWGSVGQAWVDHFLTDPGLVIVNSSAITSEFWALTGPIDYAGALAQVEHSATKIKSGSFADAIASLKTLWSVLPTTSNGVTGTQMTTMVMGLSNSQCRESRILTKAFLMGAANKLVEHYSTMNVQLRAEMLGKLCDQKVFFEGLRYVNPDKGWQKADTSPDTDSVNAFSQLIYETLYGDNYNIEVIPFGVLAPGSVNVGAPNSMATYTNLANMQQEWRADVEFFLRKLIAAVKSQSTIFDKIETFEKAEAVGTKLWQATGSNLTTYQAAYASIIAADGNNYDYQIALLMKAGTWGSPLYGLSPCSYFEHVNTHGFTYNGKASAAEKVIKDQYSGNGFRW